MLSNLSYTNKDFNSIYNELLDLVSKISPKWNPGSITDGSNESDPGVLLLKLDALLADKNNYNIDKNVLELFPDSVTQYPNARELYEQCGYIMPYYQAAESYVTLSVKNIDAAKTQLVKYSFDPFLTVTTDDATMKYVIVDPDITVVSDSATADFRALQGTHVTYTLNGNDKITLTDLDYNNRLYFKETNIAENGIFIYGYTNDNTVNYHSREVWKKVDNLLTEQQNTLCYKFGVARDGNQCYIEFPSDIANLIGGGIHIDYILTDGAAGNLNKNKLKKFFVDSPNMRVYLNSEVPNNDYSATTSSSPSDNQIRFIINNYQDSYNGADPETLESARKNYERTKNTFNTLVSLSDYNHFILNSNKVSNGFVCDRTNDIQATTKIITSDGNITSTISQVANSGSSPELSAFDLRTYLLKNSSNTTIDQFDLGFELLANNSSSITDLYKATEEVKTIQHDFKSLAESTIANIQLRYPINVKIFPYNKIDLNTQVTIQEHIVQALLKVLNSKEMEYGKEVDYDLVYDTILNADNRIKTIVLEDFDYTAYVVSLNGSSTKYIPLSLKGGETDDAKSASDYRNIIQAKSILAGLTPIYTPANNFHYTVLQQPFKNNKYGSGTSLDTSYINDIGKVTTETTLTLTPSDGTASIKLKENENIYLTAPNYINKDTYSTYVKYFHKLNQAVSKNDIYRLSEGEYIAFFWKNSDEDEVYQFAKYGARTIISPSFDLSIQTSIPTDSPSIEEAFKGAIGNDGFITKLPVTENGTLTNEQSTIISKCDRDVILSGTKQINIKGLNEVKLIHNQHKVYWILNKTEKEGDIEYYKIPFVRNSYTLKSGEYLFYAPLDDSYFALLGAGTKLTIGQVVTDASQSFSTTDIKVEARTYEEVLYGKDSLLGSEGLWYSLGNNLQFTATEMQFHNIGAGTTFNISNQGTSSVTISNGGIANLASTAILSYTVGESTTTLPSIIGFEGAENGWSGYSILNLNCQPNNSQKLLYENITGSYSRQQTIKVTSKYINNQMSPLLVTEQIIMSPNQGNPIINFETSYGLSQVGGSDIDVTAINILGERFANSFYCFTERLLDASSEHIVNNKLKVTLDTTYKDLTFSSPEIKTNESVLLPIQTIRDYKYCYLYFPSEVVNLDKTKNSHIVSSGRIIFVTSPNLVKSNEGLQLYESSATIDANKALPVGAYKVLESATLSVLSVESNKTCTIILVDENKIYKPFNRTSSGNMSLKGEYYFKFNSTDFPTEATGKKPGIFITVPEGETINSDVYIHPIVKYNKHDGVDPLSSEDKVYQEIQELDTHQKFNYTYNVLDSDLILDPTDANSFLDTKHPYNRCTICKWDSKNSKIQIINKAR